MGPARQSSRRVYGVPLFCHWLIRTSNLAHRDAVRGGGDHIISLRRFEATEVFRLKEVNRAVPGVDTMCRVPGVSPAVTQAWRNYRSHGPRCRRHGTHRAHQGRTTCLHPLVVGWSTPPHPKTELVFVDHPYHPLTNSREYCVTLLVAPILKVWGLGESRGSSVSSIKQMTSLSRTRS